MTRVLAVGSARLITRRRSLPRGWGRVEHDLETVPRMVERAESLTA
jgi:hypothetical protein